MDKRIPIMKKDFKLLPPLMPNWVNMERAPGRRQDGFNPSLGRIPITDFSKEEAEEYGELMKQTFIEHWEQKTK